MALKLILKAIYIKSCLLVFLVFFSPFTSLGEEKAALCAFRAFVCFARVDLCLQVSSSSWCQELAATCNCGTPWTFLSLPSFINPAGSGNILSWRLIIIYDHYENTPIQYTYIGNFTTKNLKKKKVFR